MAQPFSGEQQLWRPFEGRWTLHSPLGGGGRGALACLKQGVGRDVLEDPSKPGGFCGGLRPAQWAALPCVCQRASYQRGMGGAEPPAGSFPEHCVDVGRPAPMGSTLHLQQGAIVLLSLQGRWEAWGGTVRVMLRTCAPGTPHLCLATELPQPGRRRRRPRSRLDSPRGAHLPWGSPSGPRRRLRRPVGVQPTACLRQGCPQRACLVAN